MLRDKNVIMAQANNQKNERYLLYLDILGFKDLTEKRKSAEIFSIINKTLIFLYDVEDLSKKSVSTLYFSDSFILYSEPGIDEDIFRDIYQISRLLHSFLLSKGIPTRGSISFGEFNVQNDSVNKHQVYFGTALNDAYIAKQKDKWVGITILRSAWEPIASNVENYISDNAAEGIWKLRNDDILLLNPLKGILNRYKSNPNAAIPWNSKDANDMEFIIDIQAFKFLHLNSTEFRKRSDFTGDVAIKYHATTLFLREILGDEIYGWAVNKTNKYLVLHEFYNY